MSTVNTMLGSTTLVVPVIFANVGIVTGLVTLFLLCSINYKTANLLLRHGKSTEDDLPEIIYRVLGPKIFFLNSIMSAMLCYFVSVVYYLLQCNMIYNFFEYLFIALDIPIADKSSIDFSKFSYQYVCIFMAAIILFLINVGNLKFMLKIN